MMRDIILMAGIIAVFCYLYFVMGKIGLFIRDNQRISTLGDRPAGRNIIIATQAGDNIIDVQRALKAYRQAHGDVNFTYKRCAGGRLREKLKNGSADIAISKDEAVAQRCGCTGVCLDGRFWVLYGKHTAPQVKCVVAALENSEHSLKTGYRDY